MSKKKECPACAMEIEDKEKVCPICGYEFPERPWAFRWAAILLVIIMLLGIGMILLKRI